MTKIKKKYIVRCTSCNKRLFDAYSADIEIKCPYCDKLFKVKINRGFDLNECNLAQSHKGSECD